MADIGGQVGTRNPTADSQARNSKSPQQSISDFAGGAVNFAEKAIGQAGAGLKAAAEDIFKDGASGVISLLRGKGIPIDGLLDVGSELNKASWARGSGAADDDWRVRVSLPTSAGLSLDPILQRELDRTNGMIFPYTPQIIFGASASYSQIKPTHSNYPFPTYQSSQPDQLNIVGDFYIEGAAEGLYWCACVHYLRSITKMAYGNTSNRGAPPPLCSLNGYGDYVFKNVPIVVSQFTIDLPNDVDYIYIPETNTWAPTRSTINVTVIPTYSRREVQGFSLDRFVKGGYAKGKGGFI